MKIQKMCAFLLACGVIVTSVAACTSGNKPEVTAHAPATSAATEETGLTVTEETDVTQTEASETSEAEIIYFEGDRQTYANNFITAFCKYGFSRTNGTGRFNTAEPDIEEILRFVYFTTKDNDYSDFRFENYGELTYATIPFDKACEVTGKYFSYLLKEEDCQKFPEPPDKIADMVFGPYYKDGKIWFMAGDGEKYTLFGNADHAVNNSDGTQTIYFTVYQIDMDAYNELDYEGGLDKYYSMTPSEAEADQTITKYGTGTANVSIGQSGEFHLNTYEIEITG